jgi:hypothetical protein
VPTATWREETNPAGTTRASLTRGDTAAPAGPGAPQRKASGPGSARTRGEHRPLAARPRVGLYRRGGDAALQRAARTRSGVRRARGTGPITAMSLPRLHAICTFIPGIMPSRNTGPGLRSSPTPGRRCRLRGQVPRGRAPGRDRRHKEREPWRLPGAAGRVSVLKRVLQAAKPRPAWARSHGQRRRPGYPAGARAHRARGMYYMLNHKDH